MEDREPVVRGETPYEILIVITPDKIAHTIRGGPSDFQKGAVCEFGLSTSYQVMHSAGAVTAIRMGLPDADAIYKPSRSCWRAYMERKMVPPQDLTFYLSADGATVTVNQGTVPFQRVRIKPHPSRPQTRSPT